jgi:hypothetical protein
MFGKNNTKYNNVMHEYELSKLNYEGAIREYGAAITSFHVGQIVLLDEASAKFLAESDDPILPNNSIVICKVTEIIEEGNIAKLLKLRRISSDGMNSPEHGEDEVDIDYVAVPVEQRIKASNDYFSRQ